MKEMLLNFKTVCHVALNAGFNKKFDFSGFIVVYVTSGRFMALQRLLDSLA